MLTGDASALSMACGFLRISQLPRLVEIVSFFHSLLNYALFGISQVLISLPNS